MVDEMTAAQSVEQERCRQCGRGEHEVYEDGQSVMLVGCEICSGLACDMHCALSEGEFVCTDHDPDAGWDDPAIPASPQRGGADEPR